MTDRNGEYTVPADTEIRGLPEEFARLLADRERTVCFTGHRTIPTSVAAAVHANLEAEVRSLLHAGYILFLTGGAVGFDTEVHELLTSLRGEFPFLRSVIVVPCRDQSSVWPEEVRQRYLALVGSADGCICLQDEYTPDCMQRRNRFMVDHSSLCIACHTGRIRSGTGATVRYAESRGVPVRNVCPPIDPE